MVINEEEPCTHHHSDSVSFIDANINSPELEVSEDNDLELPKTSGSHLPQKTRETQEKIDKYAPSNVRIITEEPENTPQKDEVTGTLDKIMKEIRSLKQLKQDVLDLKEKSNQSYQRFRPTMGKVQMFGDSFFKYVQGSRVFGRNTRVVMNKCFTFDEVIRKLMEMDKDDEVSEVVLQCGFSDIVRERKKPTLSLKLYSNVCSCLKNCSQMF